MHSLRNSNIDRTVYIHCPLKVELGTQQTSVSWTTFRQQPTIGCDVTTTEGRLADRLPDTSRILSEKPRPPAAVTILVTP